MCDLSLVPPVSTKPSGGDNQQITTRTDLESLRTPQQQQQEVESIAKTPRQNSRKQARTRTPTDAQKAVVVQQTTKQNNNIHYHLHYMNNSSMERASVQHVGKHSTRMGSNPFGISQSGSSTKSNPKPEAPTCDSTVITTDERPDDYFRELHLMEPNGFSQNMLYPPTPLLPVVNLSPLNAKSYGDSCHKNLWSTQGTEIIDDTKNNTMAMNEASSFASSPNLTRKLSCDPVIKTKRNANPFDHDDARQETQYNLISRRRVSSSDEFQSPTGHFGKDNPSVITPAHLGTPTRSQENDGIVSSRHNLNYLIGTPQDSKLWSRQAIVSTTYKPRSSHSDSATEQREESSPLVSPIHSPPYPFVPSLQSQGGSAHSIITKTRDQQCIPPQQAMLHSPRSAHSQYFQHHPHHIQQQSGRRTPIDLKPRPSNVYQSKKYQHGYSPHWKHNQHSHPAPKLSPLHQSNAMMTRAQHVQSSTISSHYTRQHPHSLISSPTTKPNSGKAQSPSQLSRTSPEILKTLLRKKACLYEPGTSRTIALLTWLVGRSLALRYGYFSRQHLQSGVHSVVRSRIESGVITRTKVNRCMQIILNSCFYYIIPRPDGSDENSEFFKDSFRKTVKDDTNLLKSISKPWDNLEINEEALVKRGNVASSHSIDKEDEDEGNAHSKRQVLLCFNDNVRSAEDVMRCHNEFIRDAAISANLFLSPEEWLLFYQQKDEDKQSPNILTTPSSSPVVKGRPTSNTIETPYLSFEHPMCTFIEDTKQETPCTSSKDSDVHGQMSSSELANFRTSWCCKRYEHDATLCKFAHVEVNKGWLRRDPTVYDYSATMCPHVSMINNKKSPLNGCHINACQDGNRCKFAHSKEEIDYHPRNYKKKMCTAKKRSSPCCDLLDICPNLHKYNSTPLHASPLRSTPGQGAKHNVQTSYQMKEHFISGKHPTSGSNTMDIEFNIPSGSPILYLSPAPRSNLDATFTFPGLEALFRRNCATFYSEEAGPNESAKCQYTNFGIDWDEEKTQIKINAPNENGFSLFGTVV